MDNFELVNWEDDFELNGFAIVMIVKLLKQRINIDINNTKIHETQELQELHKIPNEGIINKGKRLLKENKVLKLRNEYEEKIEWYNQWEKSMNEKIKSLGLNEYYSLDVETLLGKINENDKLGFKKYTILQEVLLVPIYIDNEQVILTENTLEFSSKKISEILGINREEGKRIIKSIDKFVKDVTGYWSRIIKYGVFGLGIAALASIVFLPVIVTSVGATLGLSGGAAITGGLAAIGGGSLAVGGLGMAGGYTIVVGGGSMLGLAGGTAIASKLGNIDDGYLLVSLVKILNSIKYLNSIEYKDIDGAKNRILEKFITLKHNLERDLLINRNFSDYSEFEKKLELINYTYEQICKNA